MKRKVYLFLIVCLAVGNMLVCPASFAYDFGDSRSVTLVTKAWGALNQNDLEAALAYTNKCIELYSGKAREMQKGLKTHATGTNSEIFAYWALNDVATAYFIKGEAYRKAKQKDKAKEAFETLLKEYNFGQCWDPKGWFWKPAQGAQEKLIVMEKGVEVDFSDNSSSALTAKAWEALTNQDLVAVQNYTQKCLELYEQEAKKMQSSLDTYAWESKEKVFSYWALNDVGTSLYILGKAYEDAGKLEEAQKAYKRLVEEFTFAQCWDPGGWFWKPAEEAQTRLKSL